MSVCARAYNSTTRQPSGAVPHAVDQHSLPFSPRTVLIQLSNVSGMQPTIFVDGLDRLLLIVEVTHEDMPATETDLSLTKPTQIMHHSIHMRRLAVKKYMQGGASACTLFYNIPCMAIATGHVSDIAYV